MVRARPTTPTMLRTLVLRRHISFSLHSNYCARLGTSRIFTGEVCNEYACIVCIIRACQYVILVCGSNSHVNCVYFALWACFVLSVCGSKAMSNLCGTSLLSLYLVLSCVFLTCSSALFSLLTYFILFH